MQMSWLSLSKRLLWAPLTFPVPPTPIFEWQCNLLVIAEAMDYLSPTPFFFHVMSTCEHKNIREVATGEVGYAYKWTGQWWRHACVLFDVHLKSPRSWTAHGWYQVRNTALGPKAGPCMFFSADTSGDQEKSFPVHRWSCRITETDGTWPDHQHESSTRFFAGQNKGH